MRDKCTSNNRCKSATTPASRLGTSLSSSSYDYCRIVPIHRYFEGIQGDKQKQGELFGIQNIFKLHEHTLATKMAVCFSPDHEDCLVDTDTMYQIERAHVSDLDWAFAYMGGKQASVRRPKGKRVGVHWVYEEEAKTGKDYVNVNKLSFAQLLTWSFAGRSPRTRGSSFRRWYIPYTSGTQPMLTYYSTTPSKP